MLFFVFGLFVGCSLGVFIVAILIKPKEDHEAAWRSIEEKDGARFLKEGPYEKVYH
jgi:predicted metal-dependent phosphoesterase TrpH